MGGAVLYPHFCFQYGKTNFVYQLTACWIQLPVASGKIESKTKELINEYSREGKKKHNKGLREKTERASKAWSKTAEQVYIVVRHRVAVAQ